MFCPRYIHTLFCDDVRYESNGKVTLVGAYQGGLNIQGHTPVTLARICIMITAQTPSDRPFQKLIFRVVKDDEVLQEVVMPDETFAQEPMKLSSRKANFHTLSLFMELHSLQIDGNCTLRIKADTEEGELWAAGLEVNLIPPQDTPQLGQVVPI